MFFNPFSWWTIVLVVIPFRILGFISYLPYYPLSLIGVGKYYKRGHFIILQNIEQLLLQPKNYLKHRKSIHKQIVEDSKSFVA